MGKPTLSRRESAGLLILQVTLALLILLLSATAQSLCNGRYPSADETRVAFVAIVDGRSAG